MIHRFEPKGNSLWPGVWFEITEIPGNTVEYNYRDDNLCINWTTLAYFANETFPEVVARYRDCGLYTETTIGQQVSMNIDPNDLQPDGYDTIKATELLVEHLKDPNRKCNCEIRTLMMKGCVCNGR